MAGSVAVDARIQFVAQVAWAWDGRPAKPESPGDFRYCCQFAKPESLGDLGCCQLVFNNALTQDCRQTAEPSGAIHKTWFPPLLIRLGG